jgi:hypothetical protein
MAQNHALRSNPGSAHQGLNPRFLKELAMRTSWRQALVWGAGVLLALPLQGAEEPSQARDAEATSAVASPADTAKPILQAVRMPQEFEFAFQSFTTFYACSSLEAKLKRILLALGADPQTRVRVTGCEFGGQIARVPIARIRTASPVEATAEALAELDKTRPQRELVARVRNDRKASKAGQAESIDAPFAAQWQQVSLSRGSLGIEAGDCELIEQLNRRVFPRLSVRVVSSKLTCSPGQQPLSVPKLEVEALVELSTITDAAGKTPDVSTQQTAPAADKPVTEKKVN